MIEAERFDLQRLGLFGHELHDRGRAAGLAPVEIRGHHLDFREIARQTADPLIQIPLCHPLVTPMGSQRP